jgi:hypothetical protein
MLTSKLLLKMVLREDGNFLTKYSDEYGNC